MKYDWKDTNTTEQIIRHCGKRQHKKTKEELLCQIQRMLLRHTEKRDDYLIKFLNKFRKEIQEKKINKVPEVTPEVRDPYYWLRPEKQDDN